MPCSPLSRSCCETSRTVTWQPACAATCAMPEPIRPHPTTPTFSMAFSIAMQLASETVVILRDGVLWFALCSQSCACGDLVRRQECLRHLFFNCHAARLLLAV